jgi:aryl sulfotransferase
MNEKASTQWPQKSHEYQNHHMDSTRWNDFEHRDDDIVIATWVKSGTTWMQQIVGQLLFNGAEDLPVMDICPWLDLRIIPKNDIFELLANQKHRRFVKTHLPADALQIDPKVKYIFVGRDGRDALWSWHHHHCQYTDTAYEAFNKTPGLVGEPVPRPNQNIVEYFRAWLANDGYPIWPFFTNIRSWWEMRNLPNVLFVHFNELKRDLPGQMRRVGEFLDITIDEANWPKQVEHCTFGYMKDHAETLTPMLEQILKGGGKAFINRGTNERWRDILSEEDVRNYESTALRELGPECAKWLATGERI